MNIVEIILLVSTVAVSLYFSSCYKEQTKSSEDSK